MTIIIFIIYLNAVIFGSNRNIYIYIHLYIFTYVGYVYICVYVCLCVYIYIYIYIYIYYIYTYIYILYIYYIYIYIIPELQIKRYTPHLSNLSYNFYSSGREHLLHFFSWGGCNSVQKILFFLSSLIYCCTRLLHLLL